MLCAVLLGVVWISDGVESVGVVCLGCCLFSVVRASRVVVAASFGTLNLRIPRKTYAVYESSISRHVECFKI